ncbi:MAG: divalent metal cation transporter [Balneolaceae bacterium]
MAYTKIEHTDHPSYMTRNNSWAGLKKSLGPGLLMAGAAIGVSHLVQATRAGADYGFLLIWAVLLANLFKYPFLEFGPRYAVSAGESLIEGYNRLGSWALALFTLFTLSTMFAIHAAVTVVTASLAAELTGLPLGSFFWSAMILLLCCSLLFSGRYSILDGAMKFIMAVLALSTLAALFFALVGGDFTHLEQIEPPPVWTLGGVAFLIALMGWMPIPIDVAAWHSIWTLEREKQTGYRPTIRQSSTDFNIGYIGASLLAFAFLILGATVMYGTGEKFASSGAVFAGQLIHLYTSHLGEWAYPIIIIAAFTTMFSTTFTVTDAYPRVCSKLLLIFRPDLLSAGFTARKLYRMLLFSISAASLTFLYLMGDRFVVLIDIATTLSFLTAPVLAWMNYRLVHLPNVPESDRPPSWLRWLAIGGILFLTIFALVYLGWMIFI